MKKRKYVKMKKPQKIDMSFAGLMGNDPTAKVLEFLIIGRRRQYHISELARKTKVSRPTMYKILRRMVRQGIVTKQRCEIVMPSWTHAVPMNMYGLNMKSREAQILIRCFKSIIGV